MAVIIDAKERGLLINTNNKMLNIEYKGYTMQALPSCKWCKVQAPSFINEFGQNKRLHNASSAFMQVVQSTSSSVHQWI